MFDGTDLSLAYGTPSMEQMIPQYQQSAHPQEMQAPPPPPPPPQMPEMPSPPPAMFMQQTPAPPAVIRPPEDTLWDRISAKKLDVLKLFVLSLVVLLGISMDRIATHYLTNYVNSALLSDFQEVLVRLSYPVIVLVVLWLIKASV